ncbi:MAG: endolytic transglycosylase MltG [Flavobacteriales bacterium]
MNARRKKRGCAGRYVISFLIVILISAAFFARHFYKVIYQPNVVISGKKSAFFYIPTGSDAHDVANLLYEGNYILNRNSFEWLMQKKNYFNHVHPGRYKLKNGMSNNELINMLRSGQQLPLRITLHNFRFKEALAGKVGALLEADSASIIALLTDAAFAGRYGFNTESIMTMFIPDTYEFLWNTSAEEFLQRIAEEYKKFWTEKRLRQARALGLQQSEVSILAGIVQKETAHADEMPVVAGVYLNRLKKGMLLQADPTVVFAVGDFSIRRVLNVHKEVDSPYNTYKYSGLPPGPICMATKTAIDAVLNAGKHHYLYFCAKEDFSGYHNFAKTYAQHRINARKYQAALNKRRIYR